MKLTELNPHWVGAGGEGVTDKDGNPVPERKGVGIEFDCPSGCNRPCFVSFTNPLDGGQAFNNGHVTWERTGETFDTLTIRPSIQRMDGCKWHGFVTNGEVTGA